MVFVICSREFQSDVREKMTEILEDASYPARQIDDHPFGEDEVEIEFTLYATAVQAEELDEVVKQVEVLPGVRQAFWNAGDES
jgi:putative Mg2+ transporter-C (MgtC) family protein